MKAVTFLQIAPRLDRHGNVIGARVVKVSKFSEREPRGGVLTLKLSIDIPEAVFKPIPVNISVPIENLGPVTTSVELAH